MDGETDDDGAQFGRLNSMVRRTTTRHVTTAFTEPQTDLERVPDFLDILSQISGLYRQDALPMETYDNWTTEKLDSGAVFQVSSRKAVFKSVSRTTRSSFERQQEVVIKKVPVLVYDQSGKPLPNQESRNAAESLLRELRVLTSTEVQRHANIVKLLGVAWSYEPCPDACPSVGLILECAESTLDQFLINYSDLKFGSKQNICRDLAGGLSALHSCGIVHGDLKPANILMFKTRDYEWTAKLADFSHSLFHEGEEGGDRHLPGGTWPYAAPEWDRKAPTRLLMKTDIYSFGILIGCVMTGTDVIAVYLGNNRDVVDERLTLLKKVKDGDKMMEFMVEMLHAHDETDLEFADGDLSLVEAWLESTLPLDPELRTLSVLLGETTQTRSGKEKAFVTTIPQRVDPDFMEIPYQALEPMSNVIKAHVIHSLRRVAQDDPYTGPSGRRAAAAFELCICFASGFGVDVDKDEAIKWLVQAARMGESAAQSLSHRLLSALGQDIEPMTEELEDWLVQAASKGSWTAVQSLKTLKLSSFEDAFDNYNQLTSPSDETTSTKFSSMMQEFSSDYRPTDAAFYVSSKGPHSQTLLHWAAMHGVLEVFRFLSMAKLLNTSELDVRDSQGETPLMYACRAGRSDIVVQLVEAGADPQKANSNGENALHLLHTMDDSRIEFITELLIKRGAKCTQESKESHLQQPIFDMRLSVPGCPILRAITMNNPNLVRIILELKRKYQPALTSREQMLWRATCCKLLAWACRLANGPILEIIYAANKDVFQSSQVRTKTFWVHDQMFSIPALVVAGCVSSNPAYGQDFPERFWRYMYHGSNQRISLEQTFDVLPQFGFNLSSAQCGSFRNPLFMAVATGRADALSILLESQSPSHPLEPFGPVSPVNHSMLEAYPFEPPSHLPNHYYKTGLVDAVVLAIESGKHEIFEMLLLTRAAEALNMGPVYPVFHFWPGIQNSKYIKDEFKDIDNVTQLFPHSLVKASKTRINQTLPSHAASIHKAERGTVYKRASTKNPMGPQKSRFACLYSDGRIDYPLLYMSCITASAHRDIQFGRTLLEHLFRQPLQISRDWTPRSVLEHRSFQKLILPYPLILAAMHKWPEMLRLLLDNGANISASIYTSCETSKQFSPCMLQRPLWHKAHGLWGLFSGPRKWIAPRSIYQHLICHNDSSKDFYDEPEDENLSLGDLRLDRMQMLHFILEKGNHKAFMPSSPTAGYKELHQLYVNLRILGRRKHNVQFYNLERAIWRAVVLQWYNRPNPKKRRNGGLGLVFEAAMHNNPAALTAFLDIGYSPNGRWWNFCTLTPLDVVPSVRQQYTPEPQSSPAQSGDTQSDSEVKAQLAVANRRACQLKLLSHQGSPGLGFTAEVHIIFSILFWFIVVQFSIFSVWAISKGLPLIPEMLASYFESGVAQFDYSATMLGWLATVANILLIILTSVMFLVLSILPTMPLIYGLGGLIAGIHGIYRQGMFKESPLLPFLLPSLAFLAAFIGDTSLVLCAGKLRGPTASVVRTLVHVLKREPWHHHVQPVAAAESSEDRLASQTRPAFEDSETALQQINSSQSGRWRSWFPIRRAVWTPSITMVGEAYTDDEPHAPAVELSSQFHGQARRDRGAEHQRLLDV